MNAVVEMKSSGGALAHTQNAGRMAVAEIIQHVAMVQEVMKAVMKPDVHYGIIPGTDKPTLLKQGAEVLCMAFRVADSYQVEDLSTADSVRYRVTCTGNHQTTGTVLGSGMGEASSNEEKYKWRKAYEPEYNETPANLRRKKQGYSKQKREHYTAFQVRNEPADLANTILKMANKRAKIAMTINVTACGDMFGQDLEDMDAALREHLTRHEGDDKPEQSETPAAPTFYPQADFDANLPIWEKAIDKGTKPDDAISKINAANPKTPLSESQKATIRALAAKSVVADDAPVVAFAHVAGLIGAAQNMDTLNDAAALIAAVNDAIQKAELLDKFDARRAELA